MLQSLHSHPTDSEEVGSFLDEVHHELTVSQLDLVTETMQLEQLRLNCKKQMHDLRVSKSDQKPADDVCLKYIAQENNVRKSLKMYASAYSVSKLSDLEYGDQEVQVGTSEQIKELTQRIDELRGELSKAPISLPGIVTVANDTYSITEQERQYAWTSFEFDSTERSTIVDSESTTYGALFRFGNDAGLWDEKGRVSQRSSSSSLSSSVTNSQVKMRAKVLKVRINRPWFKETVFHNDALKMVCVHDIIIYPIP